MIDDAAPLFVQIAEHIEAQVAAGALSDGDQAPSTTELARFFRVNPATAAKGVGELVARGVLVKRRGVGMFVADGARQAVRSARLARFDADYLSPLMAEAASLGITIDQIVGMIAEKGTHP